MTDGPGKRRDAGRSLASDTRARLKIVARALMAERGADGVGVREILQLAGTKNASSLNYYFESKEGLIQELLDDIFTNAITRWKQRLERADAEGRAVSVRELLEIIIRHCDFTTPQDPNPTALRFLANALVTRRQAASTVWGADTAAFNALLLRIAPALPQISPQLLRQRLIFFAWYLVAALSAYEAAVVSRSGNVDPVWTDEDAIQNLVDTALAILEAPPSPRPGKRSFARANSPRGGGEAAPWPSLTTRSATSTCRLR